MDCTFADPVDYQGNTPSSSVIPWNWSTQHCSTPSATTTLIASGSASTSGELLTAYGDFARTEIFGISLVIFLLGVIVFLTIFKR